LEDFRDVSKGLGDYPEGEKGVSFHLKQRNRNKKYNEEYRRT